MLINAKVAMKCFIEIFYSFFRFLFYLTINISSSLPQKILIVDTLKMVDDPDDWTHLDHCYTANSCDIRIQELVEDNQVRINFC